MTNTSDTDILQLLLDKTRAGRIQWSTIRPVAPPGLRQLFRGPTYEATTADLSFELVTVRLGSAVRPRQLSIRNVVEDVETEIAAERLDEHQRGLLDKLLQAIETGAQEAPQNQRIMEALRRA